MILKGDGAIVTKDIPAGAIVAAKVVKEDVK